MTVVRSIARMEASMSRQTRWMAVLQEFPKVEFHGVKLVIRNGRGQLIQYINLSDTLDNEVNILTSSDKKRIFTFCFLLFSAG